MRYKVPMACCLLLGAQIRLPAQLRASPPSTLTVRHMLGDPGQPPGMASNDVRVSSRTYIPHRTFIQAQSNLIQVGVEVLDRGDHAIAGLSESDFRLFVDGQPHPIAFFTAEGAGPAATGSALPALPAPASKKVLNGVAVHAPEPRYVALYFDDFSMTAVQLAMARAAARKVAASGLEGPAGNLHLGIFTSSGDATLDYTSDADAWTSDIARIGVNLRMAVSGMTPGTDFSPYLAQMVKSASGGSSPYLQFAAAQMLGAGLCLTPDSCAEAAKAESDATVAAATAASADTFQALDRVIATLATKPGSRTLLVASSGFLTSELGAQQDDLVARALRAGVVIDTLDANLLETEPSGLNPFGLMMWANSRVALSDVMQSLARDTGGRFFRNNDMAGAMRQSALAAEPRYVLSFAAAAMPDDGAFHKLSVKLTRGDHLSARARAGYYDPPAEVAAVGHASQAELDAAVLGTSRPSDIPAKFSAGFLRTKSGHHEIVVEARVPVSDRRESFDFVTALFDTHNHFVIGKLGTMDLDLSKGELARDRKEGIAARLTLPVTPGVYRLREVVLNTRAHHTTVLDRTIQIPQ